MTYRHTRHTWWWCCCCLRPCALACRETLRPDGRKDLFGINRYVVSVCSIGMHCWCRCRFINYYLFSFGGHLSRSIRTTGQIVDKSFGHVFPFVVAAVVHFSCHNLSTVICMWPLSTHAQHKYNEQTRKLLLFSFHSFRYVNWACTIHTCYIRCAAIFSVSKFI